MNIPLLNVRFKRSVFILTMMLAIFAGYSEGASSPTTPSSDPPNKPGGSLDFKTKMLLVICSIFMLLFVIFLLIIGHFTWFADIRKKLEQEWEEELEAEERKRVANDILNEMRNSFEVEEAQPSGANDDGFDHRRESVDSAGCTRGRCVPPHHSILCPNNPNIPNLNEPFSFSLSKNSNNLYEDDPVEYRSTRSSTEWMNLDSSVKVSEPVPMRARSDSRMQFKSHSNFSTGCLVPKHPLTPITPDPNDIERGTVIHSPEIKFDISKLDMF